MDKFIAQVSIEFPYPDSHLSEALSALEDAIQDMLDSHFEESASFCVYDVHENENEDTDGDS